MPLLFIFFLIIGYLYFRLQNLKKTNYTSHIQQKISNCIPTFVDGGGPYYKADAPFRETIVPKEHDGENLTVQGKILKNDCKTPVPNAVLDIWQANESGKYEDVWYRGQVRTNHAGHYVFKTIVPKGYGEGTGYRPPHIHFKVHLNGKEMITSQMFFPEAKGREGFNEAYIMTIETTKNFGRISHSGYHDIILP